jgi:virginiamycin B lyase
VETLEDRCLLSYTINEFVLPTFNSRPDQILAGPDGAVWFNPSPIRTVLDRITPGGQISEVPAPFPIISFDFTPDGNIWLGGQTDIAEITREGTLLHDYPIPSDSPAVNSDTGLSIKVGPDGNVWYTEPYTHDLIGRMTPDGQLTEFPIPGGAYGPFGALDIISGPDGNLWFDATFVSSIGRITPQGEFQLFAIPDPAVRVVRGLTWGPDGNLWMGAYGYTPDFNEILRVSPQGQVTGQFATLTPGSGAAYMTVGSDGALWFAEYYANQIGRITTDGSIQ